MVLTMRDNPKELISLIAGGAGFIGSNLARSLVARGRTIAIVDNLSNGRRSYLDRDPALADVLFIEADLAKRQECQGAFETVAAHGQIVDVWHMAANSDIPAGVNNADIDHRDTFLTTFEIVRAMAPHGVKRIHFASSSAIYGDMGAQSLHEAIGPLFPISNYGAMKLASEAQLSAAAESGLEQVNLFRFPNVVGVPATHGVILDFVNKLAKDLDCLEVLGDGTQQKAYLHVSDLVDAMMMVADRDGDRVTAVNIGPVDDGVPVRAIAEQVVARINPKARISFGIGNKGWVGDVPKFVYATDRIQSMGWRPTLGSNGAIARAIDEIARQQGF